MNHPRKIINHQQAIGNEARLAEMSSVIIGREEVQFPLSAFCICQQAITYISQKYLWIKII